MVDRRKFKGTSIFRVFKNLIELELREIEDYLNEISTDLADKQQRLDEDYKNANAQVQDDPEFDPHFFFEDDLHKYFKVFPVYTFNPLLLTLYGQFETWLKKLCDLDHRKGFSKVKVSDLAGSNYIEKSRKYMELIAEVSVSATDKNWIRITEIQKIRNCIAHNNSNIVKNRQIAIEKQELYNILLNDSRFNFNKERGDFYIKDKEFLFEVINLMKLYLFDLIEQLQIRKVIAKNTTMPFDNAIWGQEKTETLLKQVISSLDLFDKNEIRTDESKDTDLKASIRGTFESMTFNLTKLYSFFSSGKWDVVDQKYIVDERENGLKKLKGIYGIKDEKQQAT
ncbi:hypothetical protein [Sediminibacterium goheungense]|uniref:Uncharacterized protein n=1 Tax=Sediminibacterium goheungense TaxID=1086393 RepID=A0A4R6J1V6_9BACT|nr:hypothetical protein [Sediminibacterium goheungense]TDO28145.1 hypothetical protein BC659_0206 [Sediminibacterium goheungense]